MRSLRGSGRRCIVPCDQVGAWGDGCRGTRKRAAAVCRRSMPPVSCRSGSGPVPEPSALIEHTGCFPKGSARCVLVLARLDPTQWDSPSPTPNRLSPFSLQADRGLRIRTGLPALPASQQQCCPEADGDPRPEGNGIQEGDFRRSTEPCSRAVQHTGILECHDGAHYVGEQDRQQKKRRPKQFHDKTPLFFPKQQEQPHRHDSGAQHQKDSRAVQRHG